MSDPKLESLITDDMLPNASTKIVESLVSAYTEIFKQTREAQLPSTYETLPSISSTSKEKIYEDALQSLRTMQGEIHPGRNDEYVPVRWVLDVVDKALGTKTI